MNRNVRPHANVLFSCVVVIIFDLKVIYSGCSSVADRLVAATVVLSIPYMGTSTSRFRAVHAQSADTMLGKASLTA